MSCKHGNHPDACEICDEVDAAYKTGVSDGRAAPSVASGAPVAALTDADIAEIHDAIPQTGNWINDFARAIEARSGVNAQLVEALREIIRNDPFVVHNSSIIAKAALAAAGVEV